MILGSELSLIMQCNITKPGKVVFSLKSSFLFYFIDFYIYNHHSTHFGERKAQRLVFYNFYIHQFHHGSKNQSLAISYKDIKYSTLCKYIIK